MRTSSPCWHDCPLYGTEAFRSVAGPTLRPGGLELTRHGLDLLVQHELAPGSRLLDLGCGPGATADFLAGCGHTVIGIDWHPGPWALGGEAQAQPSQAGQGGRAHYVCGDVCSLPFAQGSLDACVAECVLSLVDAPKALAECSRVLKDGGLLLVTDLILRPEALAEGGELPDPARATPVAGPRGSSCLAGALLPWQWEELFAAAGFDVQVREDHGKALARLMAELVWYDAVGDLEWLLPRGQGGCSTSCSSASRKRFGYALFLARKGRQAGN